jgi:hypothetical protein
MMIKRWLAGGALLVLAALPTAGVVAPQDGDPGVTAGGSVVLAASNGDVVIGTPATNGDVHIGGMAADGGEVANDLGPDNSQVKP